MTNTLVIFARAVVAAGLPAPIVARLNEEIGRIMRAPAMTERMQSLGIEAATGTPDQFAKLIAQQVPKWTQVVKASGAEAE